MEFMISRSCWSAHFVIFEKKILSVFVIKSTLPFKFKCFFHFYSFLSIFDTQLTTKWFLLCCGIYSQCAVFLESDLPLHWPLATALYLKLNEVKIELCNCKMKLILFTQAWIIIISSFIRRLHRIYKTVD